MEKQMTIEERLNYIENLILDQDEVLKTTSELLILKNFRIEILENENRIQSKQIKLLCYYMIAICLLGFILLSIKYYNAS